MNLTKENKAHIDSLSYAQLLTKWRFAPTGDPWFMDETGDYWKTRMAEKLEEIGSYKASQISKDIGWSKNCY